MNQKYIKLIKVLFDTNDTDYIILGSAATLSYTLKVGYTRQMHDLDIIADKKIVEKTKTKLLAMGFVQNTFIDKRMPFFGKLEKHSTSYYLRFSKNDIYVEVLATEFETKNGKVKFNLYPNIWAQIPQKFLVQSELAGTKFTTLDVNLLWAIKTFLANSLGRKLKYKASQRDKDLLQLKKCVDQGKAKEYLGQCRIGYKAIAFRIPQFLTN